MGDPFVGKRADAMRWLGGKKRRNDEVAPYRKKNKNKNYCL
jgi:hypothetical protein